jgi:hypothetical protein
MTDQASSFIATLSKDYFWILEFFEFFAFFLLLLFGIILLFLLVLFMVVTCYWFGATLFESPLTSENIK